MASRGETSAALIEEMVINFKNVPHEFPIVREDGGNEPFVSSSPTMAAWNMYGVDVDACRPMHKLLRAQTSRMFNILVGHLTLFISTNSYTVPEVMTASCLKKPDSKLLMRHD